MYLANPLTACLVAAALSSSSAVAQDRLPQPSFDFSEISGGESEQTVEPSRAIDAYRGIGGGASEQWARRVADDQKYSGDSSPDSMTCTRAISELYEFACEGDGGCAIEERYASKCMQARGDTAKTCVEKFDNYSSFCFGGQCNALNVGMVNRFVTVLSDTSFCSGSVVNRSDISLDPEQFAELGRAAAVPLTARHCTQSVDDKIRLTDLNLGMPRQLKIVRRFENEIGVPSDAAIFAAVDDPDFPFPARTETVEQNGIWEAVPIGTLVPFAETILIARNGLAVSRNRAAEAAALPVVDPVMCDGSSLCTAFEFGGELKHTCQSTKGGSGGPLFQRASIQGPWFLVGINQGSDGQGVVDSNEFSRLGPR